MANPNWYVVSSENPGFKGLDLDFAAGRYAADSPYSSILPPGFYTTRNSPGTAENLDGTLRIFAAGEPRITNKGLLVEEARTNVVSRSTPVTLPGYWTQGGTATPLEIEPAASSGPRGDLTMSRVRRLAGGGNRYLTQAAPVSANTVVTASVDLKAEGGGFVAVRLQGVYPIRYDVIVNLTTMQVEYAVPTGTGTVVVMAPTTRPMGNGAHRLTFSVSFTSVVGVIMITPHSTLVVADGVAAPAACSVLVDNVQVEAGAFPTSTIITEGTQATRLGDRVGITYSSGVNPWTTMAHVMIPYNQTTNSRLWEHFADANNRNVVQRTTSGNLQAITIVNGGSVTHGSYSRGGRDIVVKVASRFDTNLQLRSLCDGSNLSTAQNGSGLVTSLEDIRIASQYQSNPGSAPVNVLNGWVRQLVSYRRELSQEELKAWTTL